MEDDHSYAVGIIGSNSFLFCSVAAALVKGGHSNIRVLGKELACHLPAEIERSLDPVDGDLLDIPSLEAFFQGLDRVIYLDDFWPPPGNIPRKYRRTIREGAGNIVNIALDYQIKKLVFVSDLPWELAPPIIRPMDLDLKGAVSNRWARLKYRAELQFWRGQGEGMSTAIVVPGRLLGPGAEESRDQFLWRPFLQGLHRIPRGSTPVIDLRDLSQLIVRVVNSSLEGERILAASHHISFTTLAETLLEIRDQAQTLEELKGNSIWRARINSLLRSWLHPSEVSLSRQFLRVTRGDENWESQLPPALLPAEWTPVEQSLEAMWRSYTGA